MKTKNNAKPPEEKSLRKNLLTKVKKFLAILFALGIDKHLDYDQDEINSEKFKKKKMR